MTNPNRVHAGVPTGGQFAPSSRAEAVDTLDAAGTGEGSQQQQRLQRIATANDDLARLAQLATKQQEIVSDETVQLIGEHYAARYPDASRLYLAEWRDDNRAVRYEIGHLTDQRGEIIADTNDLFGQRIDNDDTATDTFQLSQDILPEHSTGKHGLTRDDVYTPYINLDHYRQERTP